MKKFLHITAFVLLSTVWLNACTDESDAETTAETAIETTAPETVAETTVSLPESPDYDTVRAAYEAIYPADEHSDNGWQIDWRADFTYALLTGDGGAMAKAMGVPENVYDCYDGIVVTDWRVEMQTLPYHDNGFTVDLPVLYITVTESNAPGLAPGEHALALKEGVVNTFLPVEDLTAPHPEISSAAGYVHSLFQKSDQFGICDFIVMRLDNLAEDGAPRTAEEIREYAEVCLDLDPDTLNIEQQLMAVEGGYTQFGRGGRITATTILGEEVRDDITVVTVCYYADYSCTVEAVVVEYHLEPTSIDWKLTDTVVVRDSGLPGIGYAV